MKSADSLAEPDRHDVGMWPAQLTAALDKKEALLVQLRAMNDEAASGRQKDPLTNRHSETFQRAYAAVVLQLKQARLPHGHCLTALVVVR